MKRLIVIASCLFSLTNIFAQDTFYTDNTLYGINAYQSSTGSGYGSSLNLNFFAQKSNRVFELGIMFDAKDKNIKGFEFLYKLFFGFNLAHFYTKPLKPFFYYNFIYRTPTEVIIDPSLLKSDKVNPNIGGKITTFEHAIGLGSRLAIVKRISLEGSAGFGVYLGSHYQGATPKTWGIHLRNCGFVPSFKVGLSFKL